MLYGNSTDKGIFFQNLKKAPKRVCDSIECFISAAGLVSLGIFQGEFEKDIICRAFKASASLKSALEGEIVISSHR